MQTWLCSGTCWCFSARAFVETEPQVVTFYEAANNPIIVEMKQRLRSVMMNASYVGVFFSIDCSALVTLKS